MSREGQAERTSGRRAFALAATAPGPRPRLTFRQLELVSAITKSAVLKRRLVDATESLAPGTSVRLNDEMARVGRVLGSGLVGVVNLVELDGGQVLALKRARARLAFFREALRVERRMTELLATSGALAAARVVDHGEHWIAKELVTGPTLAELLVRGDVDTEQATALEGVLEVVGHALRSWRIALDVSPKNLAWQNGWVLLDAGPKLKVGDVERVAASRSFEAYVDAYRIKLASGPSAPSVVGAPASAEELLEEPRRHAFVRDLWRWFPLDPNVDPEVFLVDVDDAAPSDEIAIERSASGALSSASGLLDTTVAAAEAAWAAEAGTDLPEADPTLGLVGAARSATGRLHARAGTSDTPRPTVVVRPYAHWRDVAVPTHGHDPLDLFCHEVFAVPKIGFDAHRIQLATPAGTFAELGCTHAPGSDRGFVFVPGFRAGIETTHALAAALMQRGVKGSFVSAYLGVRNGEGQALVDAGRWEVPLLVQVIDYAIQALDVRSVTLIAASHGAAAAMDVAAFHPGIDRLVVDAPLERPLELYFQTAHAYGQSRSDATARLVERGLPNVERAFSVPERRGLRTLALRPTPDLITDVCGFARGAQTVVEYAGPHAATMRHDTHLRGIPAACMEAITAFLAPA